MVPRLVREYVESGGGVIDVERSLSWKTIFDAGQVCADSRHPDHVRCDAQALYVVSFADEPRNLIHHRPMCPGHVASYFVAAITSGWCVCAGVHQTCRTVGARIDRLRDG